MLVVASRRCTLDFAGMRTDSMMPAAPERHVKHDDDACEFCQCGMHDSLGQPVNDWWFSYGLQTTSHVGDLGDVCPSRAKHLSQTISH